jgi:hypothetical protein
VHQPVAVVAVKVTAMEIIVDVLPRDEDVDPLATVEATDQHSIERFEMLKHNIELIKRHLIHQSVYLRQTGMCCRDTATVLALIAIKRCRFCGTISTGMRCAVAPYLNCHQVLSRLCMIGQPVKAIGHRSKPRLLIVITCWLSTLPQLRCLLPVFVHMRW